MEINNVSRDLYDHSTTNFAGNLAQGSSSINDYSQRFNANHQHQGSVTYVTHVHNHYGQSQSFSPYNPFHVSDLLPHPGGIFNAVTYPPPVIPSPRPPSPPSDTKPQDVGSNPEPDPQICQAPLCQSTSALGSVLPGPSRAVDDTDDDRRTLSDSTPPNPRHRRRDPPQVCTRVGDPKTSVEELARREARLVAGEKELELKLSGLERGFSRLKRKEKEGGCIELHLVEYKVQEALNRLEQDHICPLCYDVLSAPYMLNAPDCGHTFCGICILKWVLSRLHDCGAWHEHLACPCCRAEAPAPDRRIAFPLIPNRFVRSTITDLLDTLATVPESFAAALPGDGEGSMGDLMGQVQAWREGGQLRTEWLERERQGKDEMAALTKHWKSFRPQDWIATKARLGV